LLSQTFVDILIFRMSQGWERYLDLQMLVEPLQPPKREQSLLCLLRPMPSNWWKKENKLYFLKSALHFIPFLFSSWFSIQSKSCCNLKFSPFSLECNDGKDLCFKVLPNKFFLLNKLILGIKQQSWVLAFSKYYICLKLKFLPNKQVADVVYVLK
jgi:hypothetical protein